MNKKRAGKSPARQKVTGRGLFSAKLIQPRRPGGHPADDEELDRDHDDVLHHPAGQHDQKALVEQKGQPPGAQADVDDQRRDQHRRQDVPPVLAAGVEERAENKPGQRRGEGEAGEKAADGEDQRAQQRVALVRRQADDGGQAALVLADQPGEDQFVLIGKRFESLDFQAF